MLEDVGDFGSGELGGEGLAGAEQLADAGSAEEYVVGIVVGAVGGSAGATVRTVVESEIEGDGLDGEIGGSEPVEYALGVEGSVVIADAGMVATDDEMGAVVVLAAQRMI